MNNDFELQHILTYIDIFCLNRYLISSKFELQMCIIKKKVVLYTYNNYLPLKGTIPIMQ